MERDTFQKEVRVIEHNFNFNVATSIIAVVLLVGYILYMVIGIQGYTLFWFPIPLVFLGGFLFYSVPMAIREFKLNKQVYDAWNDPEELLRLIDYLNWKAALALAHFTTEDFVIKALTKEIMDNTNWLIRKWSVWALGYTEEKKSIPELIEVLQFDSAPEVRENAIQAIMNMNAVVDAMKQIQERASNDPIHYVRRKARQALASLEDIEL